MILWDMAASTRLIDEPLSVMEGAVLSVQRSAGVPPPSSAPLSVKEGAVLSVAFSPDGKTVAAGYENVRGGGGVVLWDVDLDSWQRRAGQIANRNFTWKEWQQYFPGEPYHATFPELPFPLEATPK